MFQHGNDFHHGTHGVHFSNFPGNQQTHLGINNHGVNTGVARGGMNRGNVTYIQQPGMAGAFGHPQNKWICIGCVGIFAFVMVASTVMTVVLIVGF